MTKRETRVVNAFLNCVKSGEFTADYATVLIEDTQKYGWLSDDAKDYFYDELEKWEEEKIQPEPEQTFEPEPNDESVEQEEPVEEEPAGE